MLRRKPSACSFRPFVPWPIPLHMALLFSGKITASQGYHQHPLVSILHFIISICNTCTFELTFLVESRLQHVATSASPVRIWYVFPLVSPCTKVKHFGFVAESSGLGLVIDTIASGSPSPIHWCNKNIRKGLSTVSMAVQIHGNAEHFNH